MKFNPSFQLRTVCGEHVLLATGAELVDFNRLVTLNFQIADVESFLLQHYDGATTTLVAADVARLIQEMKQEGVVIS